jgi:hypothetical protein
MRAPGGTRSRAVVNAVLATAIAGSFACSRTSEPGPAFAANAPNANAAHASNANESTSAPSGASTSAPSGAPVDKPVDKTVDKLGPAPPQASPPADPSAGLSFRTAAVEIRIEGIERVRDIGGHQAHPGHEFVIVDTSWKNIIPLKLVDKTPQGPTGGFSAFGGGKKPADPANQSLEPTLFAIPMLRKQMWLLSDARFADTVDLDVLASVPDHLPGDGFAIPKLDEVVRGKLVFEAPANVRYQAFQFYDTNNGSALIPLIGASAPAPPTAGPFRENEILRLAVAESGAAPSGTSAPAGLRPVVVSLRGSSRSPRDIIDVPFGQFVYAQTDQGCISRPERNPEGLTRAFDEIGSFPPTGANEGQLLFYVPADAKALRVLVRSQTSGPLDLPAAADFQPAWPKPVLTITDGTTARVHALPRHGPPSTLPAPAAGRDYRVLDVLYENLSRRGIELQLVQLRLARQDGSFIEPSPLSSQVPCRLLSDGVIPATTASRFMLVYDTAPGEPLRLNYRGFELDETTVDLP